MPVWQYEWSVVSESAYRQRMFSLNRPVLSDHDGHYPVGNPDADSFYLICICGGKAHLYEPDGFHNFLCPSGGGMVLSGYGRGVGHTLGLVCPQADPVYAAV